MTELVLELREVRKTFGGTAPVEALKNIDLAIVPGELLAIIGPSGSGKSTLLNVMGTLTRPTSGVVRLEGRELLNVVDRGTDLLPTRIQGQITGTHGDDVNLAVAINGRVAAVTRTFQGGAKTSFGAMVPEDVIENGHNDVDVLLVRGSGATRTYHELSGSDETTTLVRRAGGEVIRSSDGLTIPVRAGVVRGSVQFLKGSLLGFNGWAAESKLTHRADSVMVFADGREVFSAPTAQLLPHRVFKQSGLFGFQFELPRGLLPPQGSGHRVRVFAIRLGVATELRRKPVWPWG